MTDYAPPTEGVTTPPTEQLRIVRLIEQDMAERALIAWRSADARVGLRDHDALRQHADALTRWSERLRMAFDGNDWRDDREGRSAEAGEWVELEVLVTPDSESGYWGDGETWSDGDDATPAASGAPQ